MNLYYLAAEHLIEYEQKIAKGYPSETVALDFQRFLIIPLKGKTYAAIAWPTIDGRLTGRPISGDVLFDTDSELQGRIIPKLRNKDIKVLAFPRYE